jgi:biotin transport system permease protein
MLTLTSPVETPWHRVPAGWKLGALAIATAGLFALRDPMTLGLALAAVGAAYAAGGRAFLRHGAAMLRPLWPFLLLLVVWHLWSGEAREGVAIGLRLVAAVAAANLVTMTTRRSDMGGVMERVLAPLGRLGVPVGRVALGLALAVRFVPVMLERAGAVREAWRARSARRPGWRVMVPVTLAALDDAERAAEALRARGGAG